MEGLNAEIDNREKPPIDINQPGVLIHGIQTLSAEEALQKVLTQGLKPYNQLEKPPSQQRFKAAPDWVSLAMTGRKVRYKYTSAHFYGANDKPYDKKISVVLDPDYVKTHADEFKAVGDFLDPSDELDKKS